MTLFKLFDFVARYAKVVGDEWFKLMQWILIIGTLSFVTKFSNDPYIKGLWLISVVIMFVYILFGYLKQYIKSLEPIEPEKVSLGKILRIVFQGAAICLLVMFFAQKMASVAWEFATKLSTKLN